MDILPHFQRFLRNSHHIQKNQIPYYANWVHQFLNFSHQRHDLKIDLRIQSFLDQLQIQYKKSEWQVRQTDRAIQLYLYHFCDQQTLLTLGAKPENNLTLLDKNSIIQKAREVIHLKHYAQKTERTYIHWIKTFWQYMNNNSPHKIKTNNYTSQDVKNFLSHLAIKRHISASTQNQAFNSLLFLFRNILMIELKDMSATLRAKRGTKAPVVLTTEEIQELFKNTNGIHLLYLQWATKIGSPSFHHI